MQPLQDDLRDPAAKDNSITNAATARSNLDAAITMRSAETAASEIVAPKPDLDRQSEKKDDFALFKRIFRRKITSAKMGENLLTNHCRSLHAATPIRFTKSSCKRQ